MNAFGLFKGDHKCTEHKKNQECKHENTHATVELCFVCIFLAVILPDISFEYQN